MGIVTTPVRYGFRFCSGRPLDGRRRTDATFLQAGTVKYWQSDRTGRWSYLPEWKRAAVRLGSATVLTLLVILYLVSPPTALVCVGAVVAAGLAWVGFRVYRAARHLRVQRGVVRPLHRALVAKGVQSPSWITVPDDYATNKSAAVLIRLPEDWSGDTESRKHLFGIVSRKLGHDWDPHWTDIGKPSLRLTHAPVPPGSVSFVDVLDEIRKLSPGRVLLGLGSRGEPVVIDFNAETPHVALSIGTGGGKSATLCLFSVQLLAQGATIEGIDPKRVSLNPLRDLPGITIHRDTEQQWDAIAMVRAEMDRRYSVLDQDENAVFRRLVVIIEESNTFAIDSEDRWEVTKPKGGPKTPPVWRDLNAILNKGRQANVNVISVFQRMDAKVAGGGAARDQYGFKILGRFSPQAWKMLVDTYPRPHSSKHRGRVIAADGGDHRVVQVAYCLSSNGAKLCTEAIQHAVSGTGAIPMPGRKVPASQVSQDGTELANQGGTVPALGLSDAVDQGVLTLTLGAVRKARLRDPEFPAPVAQTGSEHLYSPDDLRRWQANRPRATQPQLLTESERAR